MKVVNSVFFLFLSVFCLTSCGDKESEKTDSIPKIASMSKYENGVLYSRLSFKYDTIGRVIEISGPYAEYNSSYNYTYKGDSIIIRHTDSKYANNINWSKVKLNSKNQMTSISSLTNNVVNGLGIFEYNKEGFKIWEVLFLLPESGTAIRSSTIVNGNIVQEIDTTHLIYNQSNSSKNIICSRNLQRVINPFTGMVENNPISKHFAPQKTESYTYINTTNYVFTDTLNTISDENMGLFYGGKSSRNLIRSFSDNVYSVKYTYILDEKGRVYKQNLDDKNYIIYTYVE